MSCPQIWNIEQEKARGKEKVGGRKAKRNKKKGDKDLGREIKKKQRRHFLVGGTTRKFCSRGDKMRNASSHQCKVKMSGSDKKVNDNTYDISSKKCVTKKFLEVSQCSHAKQPQRNIQKKCAARAKLLFSQLDLLLFFTLLQRCLHRSALHDFIFCLNKL